MNQIDALERQEEASIIAVEGQGGSILPRPDAAPSAVLGVRVATQAKTKAAA